ncbi:MAG TPA: DUF5988 family protein [Actinospica sp.]|nr:DUF5988 family protein [Actinospica sp.]
MTQAMDQRQVYLEGGPSDLPERIVPITRPGGDVKIPHLNGYEHFRATSRETDSADGPLTVYEWFERTEAVS